MWSACRAMRVKVSERLAGKVVAHRAATAFGFVSVEKLAGAAPPQVALVAADTEEVLACRPARHERLAVVVTARKVDPTEVVSIRVAAITIPIESWLDPALDTVLVLASIQECVVVFEPDAVAHHLQHAHLDPQVLGERRVIDPSPVAIEISVWRDRLLFWYARNIFDDRRAEGHLGQLVLGNFSYFVVADARVRPVEVACF